MAAYVRKKVVGLRLSTEEYEALREVAEKDGKQVTYWLRERVFTNHVKRVAFEGYRE